MCVSNQARYDIDSEISFAAVSRVSNLLYVFQLVVDCFDDGAFAREHFVH